ncbi:MAG: hypothetical protein KBC34_05710 [Phenylobacterium sp.]|nr:hypothetical protein [Phenylobacterium sp.]
MIAWMAARAAARAWWPGLVGAAVAAGPVFMLGQCSGVEIQKARDQAASLRAIEQVGRANATAAGQRTDDSRRITARHEEQSHAIQSAPDAKPSAGRLRRACVQLRQQGLERLPAECRPEG